MIVATTPRAASESEHTRMAVRRPITSEKAPAPKVPKANPDSRQNRATAELQKFCNKVSLNAYM